MPASLSFRICCFQVAHDERGEPFGRLVEQEEFRAGHEGPGDGEHLLLAAAQVPCPPCLDLSQGREETVYALLVPLVGPAEWVISRLSSTDRSAKTLRSSGT